MNASLLTPKQITQVGIWRASHQPTCWQIVWQDKKGIYQQKKINDLNEIQIKTMLGNSSSKHIRFITAILPHNILHRTIILPIGVSQLEIESQCRLTLAEHLPVPLEESWFDFTVIPLTDNQNIKVDIFAVIKDIAYRYLQEYAPINIHVLDSVSNALLAGFHHLVPNIPPKTLLLYQDEDQSIAIFEQLTRTLVKQSRLSLKELYHEFCQHYAIKPKQVIYHRTFQAECLPKDWQATPLSIPLIPLGCALWKGEY